MKIAKQALILILAALFLFAGCEQTTPNPDPAPTPAPTPNPDPVPPPKVVVPEYEGEEFLPLPDAISFAVPMRTILQDESSPYSAIHYGLFDNQMCESTSTPRGGEDVPVGTITRYSIFIPQTAQPKVPVIMILTPNGTTAAEFARGEIGQAWIQAANAEGKFCVAFIEPFPFKKDKNTVVREWNTTFSTETTTIPGSRWNPTPTVITRRDDRAAILDVFGSIRNKSITTNAYVNCDKNGVSLVGYGEGAAMAAVLAATWPTMFPNTICIDPVKVPENVIKTQLAEKTYPHNSEYKKGSSNYGNVEAGEIAMPMYVFGEGEEAQKIIDIWTDVNANALKEDKTADLELYKAEKLDTKDPADLAKLALLNGRYRGYRGGTLRFATDMYKAGSGYEVHNEVVAGSGDDRVRRWSVYTPESRPAEGKVPMVVVLHGSTAAITDIVDESKWSDVADENGFIVTYIQAYPDPDKGIHTPEWRKDDKLIDTITKKVIAEKDIDPSKVYLTGHSAGGFQIMGMMGNPEVNKTFAGFAPIGGFFPPSGDAKTLTPIWLQGGEWEYTQFNSRGDAGTAWAGKIAKGAEKAGERHGEEGYLEGKYLTQDFSVAVKDGDGTKKVMIPVKATQVMDSPHVYMAEQAAMVWDGFFSKLSRNQESGDITYDGNVFKYVAPAPKPQKPAGK